MAKNSVYDYDPTAANNTDIGGVGIVGTVNTISNLDNSQREMAGHIGAFVNDQGGALTAGGTANTLTITSGATIAALGNGLFFKFRAASDNTGAATLNLNAIGAKAIRKMDQTGDVALAAGDIQATGIYEVAYSEALNGAAGAWLLLNPTDTGTRTSLTVGTLTVNTSANPDTDGGAGLGTSLLRWANLYVVAGGFIDFNTSGLRIQESSDNLEFVGATTYNFDNDVVLSNGAPLTLGSGSDFLLPSGHVTNYNSSDITVTHSANTLTWGGATSGYVFNNGAVKPNVGVDFAGTANSATTSVLDGYTDWVAYTPSFTGFGTASSVSVWSRRIGDTLHLRGRFTSGTSTAVEARMSLGVNGVNGGITSDATKVASIQMAGPALRSTTLAGSLHILIESGVGYVVFGASTSASFAKLLGNAFLSSGDSVTFTAEIPISGW